MKSEKIHKNKGNLLTFMLYAVAVIFVFQYFISMAQAISVNLNNKENNCCPLLACIAQWPYKQIAEPIFRRRNWRCNYLGIQRSCYDKELLKNKTEKGIIDAFFSVKYGKEYDYTASLKALNPEAHKIYCNTEEQVPTKYSFFVDYSPPCSDLLRDYHSAGKNTCPNL